MKSNLFFQSGVRLSLALAAMFLAANLNAAPPRIAERLQTAYADLSSAKKDYDGHRIKAMEEIKSAAHELGLPLEKTGRAPERQRESDFQIRDAQQLLMQASDELGARGRERAGGHLDRAIEQINLALKAK